jgi:nitroreductase
MIAELIKKRRSIFPPVYDTEQAVTRDEITQLLENANWAPTHRLTEPWRFQVFHSPESRAALGLYLAEFYKKQTPEAEFSELKYKKAMENPLRSGAVIAIVMQRDPEARIPEFEEIAAVAMAVQNMWLSCTEMNLGCYWSTPKAALEASEYLGLTEGQRCLGFFYIGRHQMPETPGKRGDVALKTVWK